MDEANNIFLIQIFYAYPNQTIIHRWRKYIDNGDGYMEK